MLVPQDEGYGFDYPKSTRVPKEAFSERHSRANRSRFTSGSGLGQPLGRAREGFREAHKPILTLIGPLYSETTEPMFAA
jgi:hypothetical protein